jgi:prophage antirepressor-like protein
MQSITFDDFTFHYIIDNNEVYVTLNDLVEFIGEYRDTFLLHACSKIPLIWMNKVLNNYPYMIKRDNIIYIHYKMIIRLALDFNYNKYLQYSEIIEDNLGRIGELSENTLE